MMTLVLVVMEVECEPVTGEQLALHKLSIIVTMPLSKAPDVKLFQGQCNKWNVFMRKWSIKYYSSLALLALGSEDDTWPNAGEANK